MDAALQRLCKASNFEGDLKLPGDIKSQLGKAKDKLFHNGMSEGVEGQARTNSLERTMAMFL